MATQTVRPENGQNNKRAVVVSDDPRVVHLEGRVERVEGDVRDIKAGVQKLLDRPQNPGFTQVITTLVLTMTFCGFIFTFGEWRLGQSVLPVAADLAAAKVKVERQSDSLHAAEVRAAVLEERMNWVRELAKGKAP